jgi:ankyrin repeat protein
MKGRTPLSYAVQYVTDITLDLLSQRNVNADSRDAKGRSPLSYAAEWGQERSVKLLLKRDDVDPESRDGNGMTPLDWAKAQREMDSDYRKEKKISIALWIETRLVPWVKFRYSTLRGCD